MPLSTSQILNNRYRIVKKMAEGGFGAVYRAYDLAIKRPCALKENFETSSQAQKQFEREAVMLANLSHPNLPRVTDHFVIPGQGQYLVMDFVEGEDLQEKLDRVGGPLPESQVMPWIEQVCDALSYLHDQQSPIIHRDVKPANIKITADGKAILVDFGIAKAYDPHLKTTIGARAVTPGYSPPEQYGAGTTDARSDVYALGATLYALLTGQQPPASTDRAAGVFLAPPSSLNPGVSPHIEIAIEKAMALSQADRFLSIDAFRDALVIKKPKRILIPTWGVVAFVLIVVVIAFSMLLANRNAQLGVFAITSPTWTVSISPSNTLLPAIISGAETTATMKSLYDTQTSIPSATFSPQPTSTPSNTFTLAPSLTPSITPSPAPQLPPIMAEAYCDMFDESPVYVKRHQPVIIWWRWDAKTVAQVQDHIATARYRILLDGEEIVAERQTGIEYLSDKGWYRVSWFAEARVLSPGTHRTERFLSWDRKIFDGWDYYGPGSSIETEWDFCDIIVSSD